MSSNVNLNLWVEETGQAVFDAVNYLIENPEEAAKSLSGVGANGLPFVQRDPDGRVGSFVFEPHTFQPFAERFSGGVVVAIPFCQWALDHLVSNNGAIFVNRGVQGTYAITLDFARHLKDNQELDAALLGHRFFLERRKDSIVEIISEDEDGFSTGTGFVVRLNGSNQSGDPLKVIVTAKHVILDGNSRLRKNLTLRIRDREIDLHCANPFSRVDACVVQSESLEDVPTLGFRYGGILDQVITAGYPRVLFDEDNPLLFHSGEINGWVGDVSQGSHYGVTSAAVAPGNSGGPVFGSLGYVVGMVTDELEMKSQDRVSKHSLFVSSQQLVHELNSRYIEENSLVPEY